MNPIVLKFHCSYVSGGTCGGDSGGPFLTSVENLDTFEIKTVQLGVLHGGLLPCTNTRFPAIYTRLDHPEIHAWLLDQITTKGKWLLQIYLRPRCLKSYVCLLLGSLKILPTCFFSAKRPFYGVSFLLWCFKMKKQKDIWSERSQMYIPYFLK